MNFWMAIIILQNMEKDEKPKMNANQESYLDFIKFIESCDSTQGPNSFAEWLIMVHTTKAVVRVIGKQIDIDPVHQNKVIAAINLN